jgi:iron complex outermembrane recepter protein
MNPVRRSHPFAINPLSTALLAALAIAPVTAFAEADGADQAVELDRVEVLGERLSYAAEDGSSATKTDTPIIETPQAISVITGELLRDRGALSLQDALRYSAGVMSDAYGLDNRTDSAIIRGTEFQQVLDGMRETFSYYNIARPDPYALERVEIVRGPASVLYGQGPVAGIVNMVTKRPQADASREIVAQYGSFDRKQLAADLTGPLSADGEWLYRVVGLWRESDTQVDYATDDRVLFSPSFTWQPNDAFRWTVLATYQHDESANTISFLPHVGTVLPNPNGRIPVERFTSEPGFDRYEVEKYAITSLLEWQVSPVWTLRQNFRIADNDNPYYTMYPDVFSGPSPDNPFYPYLDDTLRTINRTIYLEERDARDFTADHQAQARFSAGGMEHNLLIGVDMARARLDTRSAFGFNDTPFDLYAPVYGLPFEIPEFGATNISRTRFTGLYAQDQVKFGDHWIGVLGLRRDRATTEIEGGDSQTDEATTRRVGLMYRTDAGFVPYLSYSESFLPNTPVNGQLVDPRRGEQAEVGVKYESPDGDTMVTATAYDLREDNVVATNPGDPTGPAILTQVDAKGLELEGIARFGEFDLVASYTYIDAEKREYTAVQPMHSASVWGKYHWRGWEFGAGARYLGSTTDDSGALHLPAVLLFDAMVAYDRDDWRFAINATNLEDEVYLTSCLDRGDCFYGNRGTVVGSVTWRF